MHHIAVTRNCYGVQNIQRTSGTSGFSKKKTVLLRSFVGLLSGQAISEFSFKQVATLYNIFACAAPCEIFVTNLNLQIH